MNSPVSGFHSSTHFTANCLKRQYPGKHESHPPKLIENISFAIKSCIFGYWQTGTGTFTCFHVPCLKANAQVSSDLINFIVVTGFPKGMNEGSFEYSIVEMIVAKNGIGQLLQI